MCTSVLSPLALGMDRVVAILVCSFIVVPLDAFLEVFVI